MSTSPRIFSQAATIEASQPEEPARHDRSAILARIPALAEAIDTNAAKRDLTGEMPYLEFGWIRAAGVGRLRIPERYGGPGGSIGDVIETIAELAKGDSSLAHALRPHFNFAESLILGPESPEQRFRINQMLNDVYFGGASTELGTPRPGGITAILSKTAQGYRLNGAKYYATGTSYSDFFYTNALNEAGQSVRLLLPTRRPGVEVLDDFDGMGQRLSASGGLRFTDVEVKEEEIYHSDKSTAGGPIGRHTSTLRQLILMACQVGSVRRIEAEAIAYTSTQARPIAHSHADTATGDFFVQREIGKIAALRQAVDVLLKSAAEVLDEDAAAIQAKHPDVEAIVTRSTFSVARTQIVIGPLALQAAEAIFNVGGGSAASRKLNFDRHWRNIRTLMSHNPLYYKEKALGDYILNDAPTPPGGAF